MGDPRRLRNKYFRPKKLWDQERITEEKGLKQMYGLKNMRELWMATSELKKYRRVARQLLSLSDEDRKDCAQKLLTKLVRLSILKDTSSLDDVLSLEVKDVLERRLQTIVQRQGLAKSIAQSRQLITHGFISVNGKKVTKPSVLVYGSDNVAYARPIEINLKSVAETPAPAAQTATPASVSAAPAK